MLADEFPEWAIWPHRARRPDRQPDDLRRGRRRRLRPRDRSRGARAERPVEDQFYGDRAGTPIDPFGHRWTIATHKEVVPPVQLERRMAEWMESQGTD